MEHKKLFDCLKAENESNSKICRKTIEQLQSWDVVIARDDPFIDEKLLKRAIRNIGKLMDLLPNSTLKKDLSELQSCYHRLLNERNRSLDTNFVSMSDCGNDSEFYF